MFLADDLLLMSLDLGRGKPRVAEAPLGVVLSAALLAEQILVSSLSVDVGELVLGDQKPPADRLAEAIFDRTRERLYQEAVTIPQWLATHRPVAVDLVVDRLVRAQQISREEHRRLGRTSTRFMVMQPGEAFMATQRVWSFLRNRVEMSDSDAVLASLSLASTPGSSPGDLDAEGADRLQLHRERLPAPLNQLVEAAEAAVLAAISGRL